ncbi:Rossmann-fold superfamily protein [Perilla frutescens var. hirtella]|uniref:Rossmann-fold superfamily protein n=1 Tax=Perilla frutescens var. hirtella TaxID=608512 RepID=A0AAD4J8S3_PERFH|nr:Rossmann-fold superfamily protein [Perilla frutescens var. hirtella]
MASKIQRQLEPWSQLDGKIIMVTGASSGLGREFCLDLAKAGGRIVAAARRIDRLNSLCDQINKMDIPTGGGYRRAIAVALDVMADGPTVEACVEKAWNAFDHIDVLINNAGVTGQNILSLELSEEEFNRVKETNLTGSWLVSKYVGAQMRNDGRGGGGGGSIINISSLFGLNRTQFHGQLAYASSKAALDSMTKIMALELGDYDIRVNSIAPGIFTSEITENLMKQSWIKNVAEKIIPLRTSGTSDPALTTLIRYLIHYSSTYITGNIFIVGAGFSLPGIPIYSSL